MASGMEMLIGTVIKSLGIDKDAMFRMADELKVEVQQFIAVQGQMVRKIDNMSLQLQAIEYRLGGKTDVHLEDDALLLPPADLATFMSRSACEANDPAGE